MSQVGKPIEKVTIKPDMIPVPEKVPAKPIEQPEPVKEPA